MEIPNEQRDRVLAALANGRTPQLKKSQRYMLAIDRNHFMTLVDRDGEPTPEGRFVYGHLGQTIPTDNRIDQGVQPYRKGPVEYAKDISGREVRLRSLEADGRTWKYTMAGRHYFSVPQAEVILKIPTKCSGVNSHGDEYSREEYLPLSHRVNVQAIALNSILNVAQKREQIKIEAKRQLGIANDENIILESISGEEWTYDPTREWKIEWLRTTPVDGRPSTDVVLNQPMGMLIDSSIPYPNMIFDVCLQRFDDKMCVCRALKEISDVNMSVEEIAMSFDGLLNHRRWRARGLTPNEVERWCRDTDRPFFVIYRAQGGWTTRSWKPANPLAKSIAFCAHDSHLFLYKDAHLLAKRVSEANEESPIRNEFNLKADVLPKIRADFKSTSPEFADWQPWNGEIKAGHFYTDSLTEARIALLQKGRSPSVSTLEGELTKLRIQCMEAIDGCKGDCVIQEMRTYMETDVTTYTTKIQAWLQAIYDLTGHRVKWRLEGLPNLALMVLKTLMRAQRHSISMSEKLKIHSKQNDKCDICKESPIEEFHHIVSVKASCRSSSQNFQGLCFSCHAELTMLESDAFRLESQLSPFAIKAYRETARAPGLAFNPHPERNDTDRHNIAFDTKRCRFNALCHYDLPSFPVFCALDSIKKLDETNPILGDLNFIETRDNRLSLLMQLPLVGNMWYSELIARHALETNLIQWSDIKLTFTATGRVQRTSFEQALAIMEEAWGDEEALAKRSCNMLVGLMAREYLERSKVITTESELPSFGTSVREFSYEIDGEIKVLFDHTTTYPLLSSDTYRPIWDCIMGWEAVKLARLRYAIERCGIPMKSITSVKTDALLIQGGVKKRKALESIESLTYESVAQMFHGGMKRFCSESYRYPVRKGDNGIVYRKEVNKKILPGEHYDKVKRSVKPMFLDKTWRELSTQNSEGDYDFTCVTAHVMNGGSLYIDGPGGCGKSHLGQILVSKLRESGKSVKVIAKTWVACRRFGMQAETADKWANFYVKKARGGTIDVLFIEEVSLLNVGLFGAISAYFQKGLQVIVSGDLFQLDPVKNSWCGTDIPENAFGNSDLLYQLAGGTRCYLNQNMRSDAVIWEFAKSLRRENADLQERLAAAKTLFPKTDRIPDCVLCISHAKRKAINTYINDSKKPDNAIRLEVGEYKGRDDWEPQDMWCWPGMRVIGHKKPCIKSQIYEVTECNDQRIILKAIADDDKSQIAVSTPTVAQCCRMFHACTYSKAQGLTIPGLIVLADSDHANFTIKHLNMGITRTTHSSLVEIG